MEVAIRGGISEEKNGLFIEIQMSSDIKRDEHMQSWYLGDPSVFYPLLVRDHRKIINLIFIFSSEKSINLLLTIPMYMFTYKYVLLLSFCIARILVFVFFISQLFRKLQSIFYAFTFGS